MTSPGFDEGVDRPDPSTADRLQAEHFIAVLQQERADVATEVAELAAALTEWQSAGDLADARCAHRVIQAKVRECAVLDGLIDGLCCRFVGG
jgi:transketolase